MAALADLAPDRRAVLQLLVGRGRSYEQIADLLSVPEIVVRRRAHEAITELAGGPAEIADSDRALLADYLVGELPASRRSQARRLLADDAGARRFARTAAARLSAIKDAQLPELPDEDEEVAEALDALDKRRERAAELQSSSRKGAWLLVAGVAIAVTAIVIVLATVAGDSGNGGTEITQRDDPAATTTAAPAGLLVAELAPPSGNAEGQAALQFGETGPVSFALTATGLPEPRQLADGRFTAYAVWLDGPGREPLRLGFYDPAGDTAGEAGKIRIGIKLDGKNTPGVEAADLEDFDTVIMSRETLRSRDDRPSAPGTIVLDGELEIGQA